MGFNTVFFVLNDFIHAIKDSPKAAAAYIYYACSGAGHSENHQRYLDIANQVASENSEPLLHFQMMEVIQSWHAGHTRYFQAGGNSMEEMEFEDTIIRKDKKTGEEYRCVVLREPEYLQKIFREQRAKDKAERAERARKRDQKRLKNQAKIAEDVIKNGGPTLSGWSEIIWKENWK